MPTVGVRAAENRGYPILIDLAPWGSAAETGLERGDRLVQLGEADLRGAGALGVYAHFVAEARRVPKPRVIYERGGRRRETTVPAPISVWPPLPASLAFLLTALFLYLRAPPSLLVRSVARASLFTAIACAAPAAGGYALNLASLAVGSLGWALAFPTMIIALLRFPRGELPATFGARVGPWLFMVIGPLTASSLAGFPLRKPIGARLVLIALVAALVAVLVVVTRRYRGMDAVERRQTRWLAFGFYAGLAPSLTATLLLLIDGLCFGEWRRLQPLLNPSTSFAVLIPLSMAVAVHRYNLFDIDRLLSATASYNLLLIALVAAGLALVPRFGELSADLLGLDPHAGQVAFSLLLASVAVPAHQRLRALMDRLLFKDRHALEQGIADLLGSLSRAEDPRVLTHLLGKGLGTLLQPNACVVYARAGEAFAPVFAAGRAVPPVFEAGSALVATLRERQKPLALSSAGRTPDRAELGPFDRAALEALQAEVVVPVRRDEALLAFLCLGPKRSGDVYTATDLSLLAAVAAAASAQLHRFDQEEVIAAGRAMQEALRRYVPGAVAEQLASGAEPAMGERPVSVLFVDLRGYTSFAEVHRAEEIFSTVNRYTEAVSEAVRAQGGAVVEFNGDGMMAVFGAPNELAHKERSAVAAGRAILEAVAAFPVEGEGDGPLTVGVGIATGPAFMGSVRAVDRLIWTVLGTTTNLAARLQALTRELDVQLVVDQTTWEALGTTASDFEVHRAVSLRGIRHAEDVYALAGVHPTARTNRTAALFRREGDVWRIAYAGREVQLRDQRGLRYLAELLRHPGKEIHSIDLVRFGGGDVLASGSATAAAASAASDGDSALSVVRRLGGAGEVIDPRARAAYRARLAELDEDLAEAERHHDLGRLETLQEEREALLAELAGAARRGNAASDAERARVAVTKGLKAAHDRIAAAHPELAAHLAATTRRGTFCSYTPDPRHPIEWEA